MSRPILIVGAGLFGSVMAERVANGLGLPVTIIDRRPHMGGNCWSGIDPATGIEVHKYGPHIFHTSHPEVWEYISRFTQWNGYRHHVWSRHKGRLYSMPINLATINSFYNRNFRPEEARRFMAEEIAREKPGDPANLEEKAISLIGRPLYEAFIRGYTQKQWDKNPRELPAEILTRLPVRFNYDSRYFNDRWEGIPLHGYAAIFRNMLANPLINVKLNTDWLDMRENISPETLVIYTGPMDQFFDHELGRLEWRTLDFETRRYPFKDYQGAAQVNEADADVKYTRKTEYRHFHPELAYEATVVVSEASRAAGPNDEPYYPVNTARNMDLYQKYVRLAASRVNIFWGGRLGSYRYLDMDKTIASALELFENMKNTLAA